MKEHNTHNNLDAIENYKEEGAITIESINVTDHELSHPHSKKSTSNFTLTTPIAIIIAAVIISGGLMGYGFITTNGNSSSTTNPLPKILKDLDLNKKDFLSCVDSPETKSAVQASLQDGAIAGVNGTPTTFIIKEINGVQYVVANVSGAQPEAYFKQAIDQALLVTSTNKLTRFKGKPITANDMQESSSPTNVYVVEYSDAECTFCISLHNTMKKIRTDYAGKISFVYRSFPLSFHPHAESEAGMIECAGKLGGTEAYYGFIDSAFDYKIKNRIEYIPMETN